MTGWRSRGGQVGNTVFLNEGGAAGMVGQAFEL